MSEPLSIAAQLAVPAPVFERWLKHALPDGRKVLDALADALDNADCNPETLFVCQYLPKSSQLLFFLGAGSSLQEAAPTLELLNHLVALGEGAVEGHLGAGRYPYGGLYEEGAWRIGAKGMRKIDEPSTDVMTALHPLLDMLLAVVPEQNRHYKALYFRKLLLRFNKRGNAGIRRATPEQPLWLDDDHSTDGTHMYWRDLCCSEEARIEGADPYHFRRVAGRIWCDDKSLFCDGRPLAQIRGPLRVMGQVVVLEHQAWCAVRDAGPLHCDEVDPASFRCLSKGDGYFADERRVWYDMTRLPEHPQAFAVLAAGMARGQNHVYLYGRCVADADAETFVCLGGSYFGDRLRLWYHDFSSSLLHDLGPASGAVQIHGRWCIDNAHVWYSGHRLAQADPASFRQVHGYFSADANQVWDQQHLVEDGALRDVIRKAWRQLIAQPT